MAWDRRVVVAEVLDMGSFRIYSEGRADRCADGWVRGVREKRRVQKGALLWPGQTGGWVGPSRPRAARV